MELTIQQAIDIAKIAIGDEKTIERMTEYLPTIGKNVVEYLNTGEVDGNDYLVASLAITDELTDDKIQGISILLAQF